MRTSTNGNGGGQGAVARDLQNVVDDTQQLLKTMESEGGAQLTAAKERMQSTLDSARTSVAAIGTNVRDGARLAARSTDEYVRSNPWRAVGIVAAAGIVVGYLAGRR